MQLTFVDLQGLVEAEAMETVQLSSHSNILLQPVAVFPQFHLLKTYIIYLIFFLAGGCGRARLYGVSEWG